MPIDPNTLRALVPYFLAAVGLLLFASLRGWRLYDRRLDTLLTLFGILVLAVIAGSMDLGTDAPSYRDYYESLLTAPVDYRWWEPGFEWLGLIFARLGAPYGLFVSVLVLASHVLKFHVFDKLTANRLQAFFVLFCFNLGEIAFVRQYLAASILLFAFYLLTRHRLLTALLLIVAATLIHKTALIVATIMLFVYYGRAALKPLAVLTLAGVALAAILPASLINAIESRIVAQIAVYTVEGFVQGLQEDTSLPRNLAKFVVYILLVIPMLTLRDRTYADAAQRKAAHVVLAISLVSMCLVAAVSTVFSRFSVYAFPFLAIAFRAERFAPRYSQLPAQVTAVLLLVVNLAVSIYPLAEFL